jgi:hypothetical protein
MTKVERNVWSEPAVKLTKRQIREKAKIDADRIMFRVSSDYFAKAREELIGMMTAASPLGASLPGVVPVR